MAMRSPEKVNVSDQSRDRARTPRRTSLHRRSLRQLRSRISNAGDCSLRFNRSEKPTVSKFHMSMVWMRAHLRLQSACVDSCLSHAVGWAIWVSSTGRCPVCHRRSGTREPKTDSAVAFVLEATAA